jgi:diguanylate cyclase (GGDEF)-like protein
VRLEGPEDSWTAELEALLEGYMSTAAASISNLRALEAMKQLAIVDTLTGLHNRRFLKDYALKQIAMARRRERRLGFITMDIDHFKSFNDKYGHEAGDRILRQFAQTVTRVVRDANLATRLGGEEFLVLLPETDANGCMAAAERIRRAVTRMTVSAGDKTISQITVSLGIAVFPDHGSSVEEVLQASDKALYESKRNGRNRATLFVEQAERTS